MFSTSTSQSSTYCFYKYNLHAFISDSHRFWGFFLFVSKDKMECLRKDSSQIQLYIIMPRIDFNKQFTFSQLEREALRFVRFVSLIKITNDKSFLTFVCTTVLHFDHWQKDKKFIYHDDCSIYECGVFGDSPS